MRVLLVANDATTAASIERMLTLENFISDRTELDENLKIGRLYHYDIVVLALTPPEPDAYELLRRVRAAQIPTPILILSPDLDPKLEALGFGADDILSKPFDRRELATRVEAIERRFRHRWGTVIRTGKLVVDLDKRIVLVAGEPLHLTGKEYGVLELLNLRKGTTLTKEMFLNHLYGGIAEPEIKVLDTYVYHLRKKLAQATGGQHYIETEWGRGYALRDPHDPQKPQQWTPRRKAALVAAVMAGEITLEEAYRRYQLTEEEFRAWQRAYEAHGLPGLRSTRRQQ
jgi:two-component system, cell cycle response regulator CtrA